MVGGDQRPCAIEPHAILGALEPEAALQRKRDLHGMMGVDGTRLGRTVDPDVATIPETDLASAVAGRVGLISSFRR